jgi:hypothetical protein
MQCIKCDDGDIDIIQFPLSMIFSYTWNKLISCVFIVHPWIMFAYAIIEFFL